jgi:hypothetical protein
VGKVNKLSSLKPISARPVLDQKDLDLVKKHLDKEHKDIKAALRN